MAGVSTTYPTSVCSCGGCNPTSSRVVLRVPSPDQATDVTDSVHSATTHHCSTGREPRRRSRTWPPRRTFQGSCDDSHSMMSWRHVGKLRQTASLHEAFTSVASLSFRYSCSGTTLLCWSRSHRKKSWSATWGTLLPE